MDDLGARIEEEEDQFLMVNIRPELSGLPFIVWISEKGGARHDVRVKVSPGPRVREFTATVSVRPFIDVVSGAMSAEDKKLLAQWIELNQKAIIDYWNGDILYTDEVLAALKKLPPRS